MVFLLASFCHFIFYSFNVDQFVFSREKNMAEIDQEIQAAEARDKVLLICLDFFY